MPTASDYRKFKLGKRRFYKPLRIQFRRLVLRLLKGLARYLEIPALHKLGRFIGRLLFGVAKREREIALHQLRQCFPELTEKDRERLAKRCFEHFCLTALEFVAMDKIKRRKDRWIRYHDEEAFLGYQRENRGCILLMSHFGNWELNSIMAEHFKVEIHASFRENEDPVISEFMRERRENEFLRLSLGRGNAEMQRALVPLIRKRKNLLVAMDVDTDVKSHFVDFFGRKAKTSSFVSNMSLRFDFPIVMVYDVMDSEGAHDVYFKRIFDPKEREGLPKPEELTALLNRELERMVRIKPESWVWFHRRWRSVETPTELSASSPSS